MRRYASIDFLRGTAILMMIVLHIVMFMLNRAIYIDNIDTVSVINIFAMIILVTAGGMAGFFLLVSAIGNGISMERNYQAGKSPKSVAIKQVVGGMLLLVFAALSEGIIGYQGALGNLFLSNSDWWTSILYRGYHMETIHTIAWCVIVNGIVQFFLARKEGWKKSKRNIKIYVILIVVVLALTPLMWYLAQLVVQYYPYGKYFLNKDQLEVKYPLWGVTPPIDYIVLFLLAPLASSVEPIFPYLAMSFVGSIIGILMTQKREEIPRKFPHTFMRIAIGMFGIGALGFFISLFMTPNPIDGLIVLYDHRYFSNIGLPPPSNNFPLHILAGFPEFAWLFQFMFLNGIGLALTVLIIRLVEFRGKGAVFGKKTLWVRRYGFVAFSMYNYQELYFLPWYIVTLILQIFDSSIKSYGNRENLPWGGVFLAMGLSLLLFEVVLRLWEKVDYAFGLEWCIGLIANKLLPVKKQATGAEGEKRKWWQVLDAKHALHEVEWLNIVEENEVPHASFSDSRLAWYLAKAGIFLFPVSFMALALAKSSARSEPPNKYNKRARILAIIGIIFFATWFTLASIFTLSDLGLGGLLS